MISAKSKVNQNPRVAFLYKSGRLNRLSDHPVPGPQEFFYGYCGFKDGGWSVDLIEEEDLPRAGFVVERLLTPIWTRLFGINAGSVARLGGAAALARLNAFEAIVATTNNQGLALARLRETGALKARVVLLAMGVMPLDLPPRHAAVYRRLLRQIEVTPISRGEERQLRRELGDDADIAYVPFGVDTRFWTPAEDGGGDGDYVLSIGNDWRRDYDTLIKAWGPDLPPLKIVTRLPVPAERPANVEIIQGDWNARIVSDEDVRELFRRAKMVVLPIRQTIQPSGQSACLQAMACGRPVVFSDIQGLWDRDAMIDGENCLLVPPGDAQALRTAVADLAANPVRMAVIGRAARQAVEQHFSLSQMDQGLMDRLSGAAS